MIISPMTGKATERGTDLFAGFIGLEKSVPFFDSRGLSLRDFHMKIYMMDSSGLGGLFVT